jgi:hypothetical protein
MPLSSMRWGITRRGEIGRYTKSRTRFDPHFSIMADASWNTTACCASTRNRASQIPYNTGFVSLLSRVWTKSGTALDFARIVDSTRWRAVAMSVSVPKLTVRVDFKFPITRLSRRQTRKSFVFWYQ